MLLTDDDLAGESIYNDDLASVVQDLEASGTAVIDDGALCVFVEGFNAPMIVRKTRRRLRLFARPTWRRSGTGSATCMPTG